MPARGAWPPESPVSRLIAPTCQVAAIQLHMLSSNHYAHGAVSDRVYDDGFREAVAFLRSVMPSDPPPSSAWWT